MTWRRPPRYFIRQEPGVVVCAGCRARCHRRVGSSVIELAVGDRAGTDSLKMVAESLLDGFVAGVGLERDVRPLFEPQERGKTFRGQASLRHPPRWFSHGRHAVPPTRPIGRPHRWTGLNRRMRKSC